MEHIARCPLVVAVGNRLRLGLSAARPLHTLLLDAGFPNGEALARHVLLLYSVVRFHNRLRHSPLVVASFARFWAELRATALPHLIFRRAVDNMWRIMHQC